MNNYYRRKRWEAPSNCVGQGWDVLSLMLFEYKGHLDLRDWGFLLCLTKVRGAIKTRSTELKTDRDGEGKSVGDKEKVLEKRDKLLIS